ncbi:MAG: tetratricopeptide repeat protein [Gammaproteobacteria bacterium]|nr:tetratricopeptide repeat protein [Gammaproteobacteria bacterium]MDH5652513.1 tetratricopeptide repeat protein [Gammaproteobacteria bacterium]
MTGRNDPCPCGSGKKFKKCCFGNTGTGTVANPAANLEQAILSFESGDYHSAIRAASLFTQVHPLEPVAWQVLGVSRYYLGEFAAAADAFTRLIKIDKKNAEAFNNLALVLLEQNKLNEALENCRQAIELQPAMASARNNLGNIYRAANRFDDAVASYLKAIELGMCTAEVYCNLGAVTHRLGRYAEAEDAYHKAMQINAGFSAAYNNLGALLLEKGELPSALENLQKAFQITPSDPEIIKNLGNYWQLAGDWGQAKRYFEQILATDKNNVDALLNIGKLYEEVGRGNDAFELYQRAVTLYPENANTNYCLGTEYFYQSNFSTAAKYIKKAIDLDPYHAEALATMGSILLFQFALAGAEHCFKLAMQYAPDNMHVVLFYVNFLTHRQRFVEAESKLDMLKQRYPNSQFVKSGLTRFYVETRQFDKASEVYRNMDKVEPNNAYILTRWAAMEELRNHLEESIELAQRAIRIEPDDISPRITLVKCLSRQKNNTAAVAELDHIELLLTENKEQNQHVVVDYYFERARVMDVIQDYDAAYANLVKANELKNRTLGKVYEREASAEKFRSLREVYNKDYTRNMPRCENVDPSQTQPVFIVGFPRSGTTLLEKILAAHSQVAACGELMFINETTDKLAARSGENAGYPAVLLEPGKVDTAVLEQLRKHYLDRVAQQGVLQQGDKLFTDKMPHNLAYLGMINMLFPKAAIIHIVRHPMDVCLSSYMANLTHGNRYTSCMTDIATHYAGMMETAEHYKSVLDMRYLELRYEDLVDQTEEYAHRVLEFVGLPWEDACLEFYKSKQIAKTASYAQVTQKIYTSSRYRYKNYYQHLLEVEPILRDAMARFGYTFEPSANSRDSAWSD